LPTYGYQCTECKYEFSVFQSMKDDPIAVCTQCGGKVKRLLYPVGIVFKGTGWYINDSRPPEKTEKTEKADSADKSEKTETAAATPAADSSGDAKPGTPAKESKPEAAPAPAAAATPAK
jgi:putative FmdB family regulatory protein